MAASQQFAVFHGARDMAVTHGYEVLVEVQMGAAQFSTYIAPEAARALAFQLVDQANRADAAQAAYQKRKTP